MILETSMINNARGTTQVAVFTATLGINQFLCIYAAITERVYSFSLSSSRLRSYKYRLLSTALTKRRLSLHKIFGILFVKAFP